MRARSTRQRARRVATKCGIKYQRTKELTSRFAMMRRLLRSRLARHRPFSLTGPEILNFGHPSGTCRFGSDPTISVLNPNPENQVHGISNLYVVDASFLPSSSAANPSLAVAANALRVAERIARRLAPTSLRERVDNRAPSISATVVQARNAESCKLS
jgi:choline dehydrogenase-like flavoprotein